MRIIRLSLTYVLCLQFLFEEYQSTSNAVLREEQTKGGRLFSLDFMRWLDEAEQNCDDPERKERLGALAGDHPLLHTP